MLERSDVERAAARLHGWANRTPVITSRLLNEGVGALAFLKAENLQRVGAFKFRGAFNRISNLTPQELERGVSAYSSGNHAQAVALAARLLGSRATILMPADAPQVKVDAVRSYGAEILTYDRYTEDRVKLGERLAEERGMTLVAPYDDPLVMAGQGTAALELLSDVPDIDLLIVPVGGGGLIAGSAVAVKGPRGTTRVVGVEPESGDDTRQSLLAGERVSIPVPSTIADALQAERPGRLTWEVNRRVVDEIVTVSDHEISIAMRFCLERLKTVVEPGGAVGLAALLAGKTPRSRKTGIILSGGNVDLSRLPEFLSIG
jgi:threonine dehydratase